MKLFNHSTLRGLTGVLIGLCALSAFAGGVYGIRGADGVPTSWLAGSPFSNYLIPSIVLFAVVGGSLALATAATLARTRWTRAALLVAGAVMLLWIGTQVAIIGPRSWLQPVAAAVGFVLLAASAFVPRRR